MEFLQVARAIDVMRSSGIEDVGLITAKSKQANSAILAIAKLPSLVGWAGFRIRHSFHQGEQGMQRKPHTLLLLAVVASVAAGAGCDKLRARDKLNKGVQAYKGGQTDLAIEDFKQAKDLDPSLTNARLYLATAYSAQYIPGAPSDENVRNGQQAAQEFKDILAKDPNNLSAIDGLGSILYNMGGTPFDPKKFEESKTYHEKHVELKPEDPEPYYWVGVIDWSLAFRGNRDLREEYNKTAKKTIR